MSDSNRCHDCKAPAEITIYTWSQMAFKIFKINFHVISFNPCTITEFLNPKLCEEPQYNMMQIKV